MREKVERAAAEEVLTWARGQWRADYSQEPWVQHLRNVATVAERVAGACGMDAERAYVLGLLHDIGRCYGVDVGVEHTVIGYNLLQERGMPEAARVCMTHTYYGHKELERGHLFELLERTCAGKPERVCEGKSYLDFTRDFLEEVEMDEYDWLIQLADNMGCHYGIGTINERFCDILSRHEQVAPRKHLAVLHGLKEYFDKKAGRNIYGLFEQEIAQTLLR